MAWVFYGVWCAQRTGTLVHWRVGRLMCQCARNFKKRHPLIFSRLAAFPQPRTMPFFRVFRVFRGSNILAVWRPFSMLPGWRTSVSCNWGAIRQTTNPRPVCTPFSMHPWQKTSVSCIWGSDPADGNCSTFNFHQPDMVKTPQKNTRLQRMGKITKTKVN